MNKLRQIVCVFLGHSRIVTNCFGYKNCYRCDDQIGDTLGGSFDMKGKVLVGHDCEMCHANFEALTWRDKLLTPNPFNKEKA